MKTVLPADCGNSPRIAIVGEFVTNWAERSTEAMAGWLTDDAEWTIVGDETVNGEDLVSRVCPLSTPHLLEVTSIITHGRLASCDGFLDTDSGRLFFSHVFRFASTSKTAKIREARTYLVEKVV